VSARPRRFDLVVFDWDGTLIDSTTLIAECIRSACADVGTAVPSVRDARYVIGLGLAEALRHAAPELPVERHRDLAERYRHHYWAVHDSLVFFEGTLPMLEGLRARGHRLAVATGKSRRGLDRSVVGSPLERLFEATRTADETAGKPDPRMLHELMAETGVPPERTLMVGDTTHDLQLAANAGCASVAVAFGAHEHERFAALPPEAAPLAVVDSTAELAAWLEANA
jgi:phosphoglycolate phosphatase